MAAQLEIREVMGPALAESPPSSREQVDGTTALAGNLQQSPHRGPTHTILFADLCGFTAYTHRHGDQRAADLAVSFHDRVRTLAAEEGCRFVKSIGDAVMIYSDNCEVALRLACRIVAFGEQDHYPRVRVGLDSGPAVERDGDWYGSTVNSAARLAAAATPGELLLTDRARSALAGVGSFRLRRRGVRRLKGLPAAVLHAATAA